jgi:hypothetical protein
VTRTGTPWQIIVDLASTPSVTYPVLQFEGDRILPGMQDVVRALSPVAATTWTVASWLTSPSADLGGKTPLERLRRGDVPDVTPVADRLAAAWAR